MLGVRQSFRPALRSPLSMHANVTSYFVVNILLLRIIIFYTQCSHRYIQHSLISLPRSSPSSAPTQVVHSSALACLISMLTSTVFSDRRKAISRRNNRCIEFPSHHSSLGFAFTSVVLGAIRTARCVRKRLRSPFGGRYYQPRVRGDSNASTSKANGSLTACLLNSLPPLGPLRRSSYG